MRHRPQRIERLLHYQRPLPMIDDPEWHGSWRARQEAVYRALMESKRAADDNVDDSLPPEK